MGVKVTMRKQTAIAMTFAWMSMIPVSAIAQVEEPVETDETLIVRTVSGVNVCTNLADGGSCGTERWLITVYADGTRTLRTFLDWSNRASQLTAVLRVDEEFRPVDAFAQTHSGGAFLGTGLYVVADGMLTQTIHTPTDVFSETTALPDRFSLLLHPVSADGWHYGYYDMEAGGPQTGQQCTLGAAGRSVMCALSERPLEFVGTEDITVPAGTFTTQRFRFGDSTELWVTGPDRVVVQHEYRAGGTRYQLTEYQNTDAP